MMWVAPAVPSSSAWQVGRRACIQARALPIADHTNTPGCAPTNNTHQSCQCNDHCIGHADPNDYKRAGSGRARKASKQAYPEDAYHASFSHGTLRSETTRALSLHNHHNHQINNRERHASMLITIVMLVSFQQETVLY